MSIEGAVYDRLNNFAGLTALLGANGVYKDVIPGEAALPAIAYQLVSHNAISAARSDTEWFVARIQITVAGGTQQQHVDIAQQLRFALQRHSGGDQQIAIGDTRLENETDLPYDHLTGEIARVIDYLVYYYEK